MQDKMSGKPASVHITDSNQRIIQTSGPSKRLYEVWRGSNKFFLGGRLIFGPDVRSLMLTIPLILVPVFFFVLFVSHRLITEFQHQLGNFIVAIVIIFAAFDIIFLFLTSSRDPGIVPRNANPPQPSDVGTSPSLSSEWSGGYGGPTTPQTKDVFVNGIIVKVKYCNTCMLYRPPRCSHCSICNNCVERFDHHCPWVGQCIGRRNYRFFFMFVSCTTLLCLYVFSFCWVNLTWIMKAYRCSLWKAFMESPMSGFLIMYTFIGAWFVGGLTTFHLYLVCTNQTTYENFRSRYDGKKNPYNHGCMHNIKEILFSEVPDSMNNFRAIVKDDPATFTPANSLPRVRSTEKTKNRKIIASDELQEIEHQFSFGSLERCVVQPRHSIWSAEKGKWNADGLSGDFGVGLNWEGRQSMGGFSSEFEMEHGFGDSGKIQEFH